MEILECFLRKIVQPACRGILLNLPVPNGSVEFQKPGPEFGQLLERQSNDRPPEFRLLLMREV